MCACCIDYLLNLATVILDVTSHILLMGGPPRSLGPSLQKTWVPNWAMNQVGKMLVKQIRCATNPVFATESILVLQRHTNCVLLVFGFHGGNLTVKGPRNVFPNIPNIQEGNQHHKSGVETARHFDAIA